MNGLQLLTRMRNKLAHFETSLVDQMSAFSNSILMIGVAFIDSANQSVAFLPWAGLPFGRLALHQILHQIF